MPLDPEKIKQLIAKKNAPKRRAGGGSKKVDLSVRDMATWFAVGSRLMSNPDTGELLKCENPNCKDPRESGILVIEVDSVYMCRYCFLDGWLTKNPAQEEVGIADGHN